MISRALHVIVSAVPLALGWVCGMTYKIIILAKAAFAEGFEAGRKL